MNQQALSREKIFNIPGVVLGLIVILAAIHALRMYVLTPDQDAEILSLFAFVPGRFTYIFDPIGVSDMFAGLPRGEQADAAQFFLGNGSPQPWTVLTYAFLHADWVHFGINSIWLAAFGAPVARRFGAWRFLAFAAVTAIAGVGAFYLFNRYNLEPLIGASAAISGMMAAAVRFVFVPGAPLDATLGFGGRADDGAYQRPALPLRRVLRDRRAVAFIVIWFVANFVFGAASVPLGITQWSVAWRAHVGGFLAGFFLFPLFDPPRDYADLEAPSTQAELQDPYPPR